MLNAEHNPAGRGGTLKSVAVVAREPQPEIFDTVLGAGDYDVAFVESIDRAYSCIKRVNPDLVIVCLALSDVDSFHLLSMLNLDRDTAAIPVCTYIVSPEAVEHGRELSDDFASCAPTRTLAASMN